MKRSRPFDTGSVDEAACYRAIDYSLMRGQTSHGAHVMDVGAGWPNPLEANAAEDEAAKADIIFVQLPAKSVADASGASMNVQVVDALRYIMHRTEPNARVVVNLSYGYFAGPHDGSSLLEQAIDEMIESRGENFQVVIPAGNSFDSACHARFSLESGRSRKLFWEVGANDETDSFLEIWYSDADDIGISVTSPEGSKLRNVRLGEVAALGGSPNSTATCTIVHVRDASQRASATSSHCALIALSPTSCADATRETVPYGIWEVSVARAKSEEKVPAVVVDAWIERDDPILESGRTARQSRFVVNPAAKADEDYDAAAAVRKSGTLNAIATGRRTVVVGACVLNEDELSSYTAAGPGRNEVRRSGPDWLAPADESDLLRGRAAAGNLSGTYVRMTGTSVAAPQVARRYLGGRPKGRRMVTKQSRLRKVVGSRGQRRIT